MKHFYEFIQGWSHYLEPWYKYIVPRLPNRPRVVEVGCWHGRSTACLAVELINCKQNFKLWAVDHWLGCNEGYYTQNQVLDDLAHDRPYQEFCKNLEPVMDKIQVIRNTSVLASEQFEDNSLDLVIIDDDHDKQAVLHSIAAWWPKVKLGGLLCGDDHDACYPGVINAVRQIFELNYQLYTKLGWADVSANSDGVWVVTKNSNSNIDPSQLAEDPWELKIPYRTEPESNPEIIETEMETLMEEIIPTSALQNPKIRVIV
jgi:SAM-dependent methyltransferase